MLVTVEQIFFGCAGVRSTMAPPVWYFFGIKDYICGIASMTLKVIQINVWKGKLLPALIPWLLAEAPDIITAQELSSGNENGCPDKTLELFSHLEAQLHMNGAMAKDWSVRDRPNDYFAKGVYAKG